MFALLLAASVFGCSKDHELGPANPRDPSNGGLTPPVPVQLELAVGNRQITLSWGLPDSSFADEVRQYRIYRREASSDAVILADSSATSPKTIHGFNNGELTFLSISAVLDNGIEGRRSPEAAGAAALFGVVVDGGNAVTRSRGVALGLSAPAGTGAVRIASTADFTDAVTKDFQPVVAWSLPDGDGEKTVYVRFVDAQGNMSEDLRDGIRLDTRAEIASVDFDGSTERQPGDLIRFTLDAREAGGTAEVELGRGGPRRGLRDDGVTPDGTAADGVYTLEYEAEAAVPLLEAEVIGHFLDEAGNQAAERVTPRRLSILEAPPALVLEAAESAAPDEITLTWSHVPQGAAFGSYRLYRGDQPGVADSPARELVAQIADPGQIEHTDSGLSPGRTYYYVVALVDPLGFSTFSNELSTSTRTNDPPTAVVLSEPFGITENSASLTWSRCFDPDFSLYRILRGEQPGVVEDPQRRTLGEVADAVQTSFEDQNGVEEGKRYYYVIETVDDFGARSASNEVSATILDLFPAPVELTGPDPAGETTLGLLWTQSQDRDFESYRLYRSADPGVDETDDLIATVTDRERVRWQDSGLIENTDYYYRVFVRDNGAHTTPSNEISLSTANADPPAVTFSQVTEVVGAQTPTLDLTWVATTVHDFEAYRIYRDTSPSVGEDATLVRSIDARGTTTFRDTGLTDNTRYYYRIFLADDGGATTGSVERSIVTANRPPRPVTLSVSATTTTSISLSWTPNADVDFLEYRVLRGTTPGNIGTTLATFSRVEQTTYTDFLPGQDPDQDLFYKVVVVDREIGGAGSLSSDSNIVSGRVSPP
jgi:hypothetical protein